MRTPVRFVADRSRFEAINMSVQGNPLSVGDRELFLDILVQREALYEDLLPGQPNQFRRVLFNLKEIDVYQFYTDVKLCTTAFMQLCTADCPDDTWSGFKRQIRRNHVSSMWFPSTCQAFFPIDSEKKFSLLRQWLVFDSRMNFRDVDYGDRLEKEYLADEGRLRDLHYDEDLVAELRSVVSFWFRDLDFTKVKPRFGPGATATLRRGSSFVEKANELSANDDLLRICREIFWIDPEDFLPDPSRAVAGVEWSCSKIHFVPKTPITNRVISAEPTVLSWFQQALRSVFYRYFDEHRNEMHISLRDQERSQRLALVGSLHGDMSTIDLSKASDTVTIQLVREIFADRPDILFCLEKTRCVYTQLPSGQVVELAKFAPMGSAVCFPIESLVFSAVCMVAVRRRRLHSAYAVYGDDIVIETTLFDDVCELLTQLHFKVNEDKSFNNTSRYRFREACGIEALNGQDITPLRVPRFFQGAYRAKQFSKNRRGQMAALFPEAIVGLTEYINRCTLTPYETLRSVLHMQARDSWWYYQVLRVPYGTEGPRPCIICLGDTATNYKVKHRYNKSLWRPEVQVLTLYARPNRRPLDNLDHLRLFLWFWYSEAEDHRERTDWLSASLGVTSDPRGRTLTSQDIDRMIDDNVISYDGTAHASLRLAWVPC